MPENRGNEAYPYAPWSRIPSLVEMTQEAGVDFDEFIACIKDDMSVEEMAEKFQVSKSTINILKEHFMHYGISSVIGGD